MRYPRMQLQKLSCRANTKCLRLAICSRSVYLEPIGVVRTRCLSSSSSGHFVFSTIASPRGHLRSAQTVRCTSPLRTQVKQYSTAHAAQDLAPRWQHDEAEEDPKPYTGDFLESHPSEDGIKALKRALLVRHVDLLNTRGLLRKLLGRLRGHGSTVLFDGFKLWDDVVPILAEHLSLQHTIIQSSSPYYDHVISVQKSDSDYKNTSPIVGTHVLMQSSEQPLNSEEVNESLVDLLHNHVFVNNVEHWLRDFAENVDNPHYPVWKVFMLVCKNSPPVMPRLEIFPVNDLSAEGPDMTGSRSTSHQLRLVNEQYNILIVQCLDANRILSEAILNEALLQYLKAIREVLPSDEDYHFRFDPGMWEPGQFLGKALSTLGWGDVRFEEAHSEDFLPSMPAHDLWQIKLSTPRHGQLDIPTIWHSKKSTRLLAMLCACNVVKNHLQDAYQSGRLVPEEYQVFAQFWNEAVPEARQTDTVATDTPSLAIHKVTVNDTIASSMLEALRALVNAGFRATYKWDSAASNGLQLSHTRSRAMLQDYCLDRKLYQTYIRRGVRIRTDALDLPVRDEKICSDIKAAVGNGAVTIITAATGSGKTTQVPQIILDEFISAQKGSLCSIICTQPRRVSTISVATRVASERFQPLGHEVGYKVRFDAHPTQHDCGITYMTSGYLSRLLEVEPLDILCRHSHIILDEVHTRDVDTDLILANLKNFLGRRTVSNTAKMPKIILMSASINAAFFQKYFEELEPGINVTTINVPGKMYDINHQNLDHLFSELQQTHPDRLSHLLAIPEIGKYVKEQMTITPDDQEALDANNPVEATAIDTLKLTNHDLFVPVSLIHLMIIHLLSTTSSGDILVFMPGLGEIDALETLLLNDTLSQPDLSDPDRCRIFKLHSALYQTNYDVFKELPLGCRRIVLATNIAETSITLPNVKFVIDTGLSRQNTFDQVTQSGTFGLQWISKAEVMQRKGRAGRTQAGVYYGFYSQAQYAAMSDAPTPEILRMSLDHLVLRASSSPASHVHKDFWPKVPEIEDVCTGHTLLTTPSPPEVSNVAAAGQQLQYIHALTAKGRPTPMGQVLSRFPMNPTDAKAVLLGIVFRCLDATLISGSLRDDSPLMYDPAGIGGTAERRRKLANGTDDDKWADSQAFFSYDRARRQKDNVAAQEIKDELSIRHDAYCEYAQIAEQTFETILPIMGSHVEDSNELHSTPRPLFPVTPPALNINSGNADLVKALAFSTSGTRFACWNHKNWRAQLHSRVLPHPKSVNHNASRRAIVAQRLRRENGDLLSYGTMRTIPKDKYPWLHDTSAITPLMAILFAESVSYLEDESAFLLNGWVRYELSPANSSQNVPRAAKIIWEYRKALDRFVAHAMQMISLEPEKVLKVRNGELNANDFNKYFGREDNPIRKIIVDSVIEILGIDAKDRKDRAVIRALENEGIDPAMAENVHERGDLETLIEHILERNKANAARDTPKKFKKPSKITLDSLRAKGEHAVEEAIDD